MRIVVSGCRHFTDEDWIEKTLSQYFGVKDLVITGGARGVDQIAHAFARRRFCDTQVFEADWDKHGKAAGPIRNREMLKDAGILVALWDGKSRGTGNAIKQASELGVETHIHYPDSVQTRRGDE